MAVAVPESYQYLPITDHDGIRLIILQPSPDEAAAIQCEVIHNTLQQARLDIYDHYTALSYVWGDADDTTTISVDGRPLRITASLECALRHLRDAKRCLKVWADGVCINQKDDTEKGKQVQQMGKVYETATHTVIFLGQGEPAAETLLSAALSSKGVGDEVRVRALDYLLQSEWFYRVWIFQELVLSKDPMIQYGTIRLPWDVFCGLTNNVKTLPHLTKEDSKRLKISLWSSALAASPQVLLSFPQRINVVERMHEAKTKTTQSSLERVFEPSAENLQPQTTRDALFRQLLDILVSRRGFGVSDPRDMIFAHLGLIDTAVVEVDYDKTPAQVFEIFVEQYIAATLNLDIFAHIEDIQQEQRRPDLATWAIDWASHSSFAGPRHMNLRNNVKYRTYKIPRHTEDYEANYLLRDRTIEIRAHSFSTVKSLSHVLNTSSYVSHRAGMSVSSTNTLDRSGDCAKSWLREQLNKTHQVIESFLTDHKNMLTRYLLEEIDQSTVSGQSLLDGRRLASIQGWDGTGRYFALVPASTKIGDLICFPLIHQDPLVLRLLQQPFKGKTKRKGTPVNLIGQCLSGRELQEFTGGYCHYTGGVNMSLSSVELLSIH